MLRGTKTTVLTLVTICLAGCANSDFVVQPHRQSARLPVQDARIYNARVEVPPKILPETYFAAGSLLEAQGLLGGAIEQYQKATAVNHNYVAAYHRLGLLLSAVGRHERATKALRRAVVLLPDNATLRNNLGYSLMQQQLWADAEGEFSQALQLSPGFPRAHINHGLAQSKLGRFDAALASFEAVLPETAAYYNLGLMYRGQHRFEKAVETFGHVLSINPAFTAASTQLEQLAPHFPPALPLERVAGAAGPVDQKRDTTSVEQLPTPFGPVVWDEIGPPIEAVVSIDPTTAVDPLISFEQFPELSAETRAVEQFPFSDAGSSSLHDPSNGEKPRGPKPAARNPEAQPALARADSPFKRTSAVPDARHRKAEPALETMSETIVALGDFREYRPTAEEVEAQLQVVRNEIDCLEDLEAQEQDEFTLNFADLVCEAEPLLVFDGSIASEADLVTGASEQDDSFAPWLSTPNVAQLTLDQLLGILPPPTATPVKTMGMSIVPPDPDTIDACPADQPEIASHPFVEEQPDPCKEEEQTPSRDRRGAGLKAG